MWDDDKQEWVSRWGRGGKNREKEDVWLSEVKAGAGECGHSSAHLLLISHFRHLSDIHRCISSGHHMI